MANREEELTRGVDLAIAGDWEAAHEIAQRHEGDAVADWLHAVLHKIGGDVANSHYWYRRSPHTFDEFSNANAELAAIRDFLSR
jgi:hypothetical protein